MLQYKFCLGHHNFFYEGFSDKELPNDDKTVSCNPEERNHESTLTNIPPTKVPPIEVGKYLLSIVLSYNANN